jgi:predicted RNA-binding protein YlqC (UPF0109 family)
VKLVHLVGFIIKKFVTMHGHVNVKKIRGFLMIKKLFDQKDPGNQVVVM